MEDLYNDPRFAHIHSDPKFRLMPKSKRKVIIDSRFESLFSNKHFSHKTNVDKRGRPALSSSRDKHVMSRFYHLSHNDDEPGPVDLKQVKQKKKGISQHHVSYNSQTRPSKRRKYTASEDDYHYNLLTKDHQVSTDVSSNKEQQEEEEQTSEEEEEQTSEEEDEQTSEEEEEEGEQTSDEEEELAEFNEEFVMEETEVDHKWNELHADADQVVQSTTRLAVCNMDWDFVKAQDLFILFKSFVPENGHIKSVTIYPSEFGKRRMAEEARLGPLEMREFTQEQGSGTGKRKEQGSRAGKRKEQGSRAGKRKELSMDNHQAKQCEQQEEAGTAQTEKLREYQLNRLRYYFGVVECDCVATADSVYSECDGREYQLSSIKLDLRFIPNDMTFHDQPKDMFSQEQSIVNYQPHRFTSSALSQAKVDVTWDQTDFDRLSHSVAKLQHKELEAIVEENKFSDIIAPPESDSEEEQQDSDGRPSWLQTAMEEDGGKILTEEEKISVYRKVLMSKLADDDDEENAGELDQEYVWQPGLKPAAQKKVQRKERREANTGVVSQLLEKRKDKKRRKKEERLKKKKTDQECADDDDEVVVEASTDRDSAKSGFKKKKKLGSKGSTEQRTQLQLLFMDSSSSKNDDDVVKTKRKKKQKNCAADSDQFVMDVDDPRFAALYTSHHFHIDPNSSQFKKSKNMQALLDEQIKKKRSGVGSKSSNFNKSSSSNTSHLLLESLKRKIIK